MLNAAELRAADRIRQRLPAVFTAGVRYVYRLIDNELWLIDPDDPRPDERSASKEK